jgi:hypothetical protein
LVASYIALFLEDLTKYRDAAFAERYFFCRERKRQFPTKHKFLNGAAARRTAA